MAIYERVSIICVEEGTICHFKRSSAIYSIYAVCASSDGMDFRAKLQETWICVQYFRLSSSLSKEKNLTSTNHTKQVMWRKEDLHSKCYIKVGLGNKTSSSGGVDLVHLATAPAARRAVQFY